MHAEQDDLAAAAEYIGLHLHPEELRTDYVLHLRDRHRWGDALEWGQQILMVLQTLDDEFTRRLLYDLSVGVVAAALYDKVKKPDANIERLREEQRVALAEQREALTRLEELIRKGPEHRPLSDPGIAARVDEDNRQLMEKARLSREFHERMLRQVQDSDPAVAAKIEDALRLLKARGAAALVNDVNAAPTAHPPRPRGMDLRRWPPITGVTGRWWLKQSK